jgi:hypothetical protein
MNATIGAGSIEFARRLLLFFSPSLNLPRRIFQLKSEQSHELSKIEWQNWLLMYDAMQPQSPNDKIM